MAPENQEFSSKWNNVVNKLSQQFADGERLDIESIMYLIGIQELGKGYQEFTKDDKVNLMHIAICCILEPFGYYKYEARDEEGWPHYKLIKDLPNLSPTAQTKLMQEAIILYFNNTL